MMSRTIERDSLVGREQERAALELALAGLRAGKGGFALVAGEAGVGKTRLVEGVLRVDGVVFVRGDAPEQAPPPYGPIGAALRASLRVDPCALDDCGPLARYLRILLPERGSRPRGGDRATMFEAVRCAFQSIARRAPTVVFLDDLQWADATTCELLPALAAGLADERLLMVGAYRSDEIARGHPLRRMRADLRRAGRLEELALDPLDLERSSELASRVLGAAPAQSLARTLHDRTQGFPFFIEEFCAALVAAERVVETRSGLELFGGDELPLPDTVRDAVLARAEQLSPDARRVLDVASVAGLRFDLALVAELAGEAAIDDPVSSASWSRSSRVSRRSATPSRARRSIATSRGAGGACCTGGWRNCWRSVALVRRCLRSTGRRRRSRHGPGWRSSRRRRTSTPHMPTATRSSGAVARSSCGPATTRRDVWRSWTGSRSAPS